MPTFETFSDISFLEFSAWSFSPPLICFVFINRLYFFSHCYFGKMYIHSDPLFVNLVYGFYLRQFWRSTSFGILERDHSSQIYLLSSHQFLLQASALASWDGSFFQLLGYVIFETEFKSYIYWFKGFSLSKFVYRFTDRNPPTLVKI